MKKVKNMNRELIKALAAASLALTGGTAGAAEYWLCADTTTITLPDDTPVGAGTVGTRNVLMWGYRQASSATAWANGCDGPVQIPGPRLMVPAGDPTGLTVHLRNNSIPEGVSIVIPGQAMPTDATTGTLLAPVTFTDAAGRTRVRSFTSEAMAPAGAQAGTTVDYHWASFKPGTYLYHSGSHVQLQVQMGLYGMATANAVDAVTTPTSAPAQPYATGVPGQSYAYDREVTLLYSEVDPVIHDAVQNGTYTACTGGVGACEADVAAGKTPSTIDYQASFYLVNGHPFTTRLKARLYAGEAAAATGGTTLVRFLNAGLTDHVPMVMNTRFSIIAEDGKPYTDRVRDQDSVFLSPLKTKDVLLTIPAGSAAADYPVYDHAMGMTNGAAAYGPGGNIAYLAVAAATDTDADGVPDTVDNCVNVSNGPLTVGMEVKPWLVQRDTDNDGYGNLCDADLNNDAIVNGPDFGTFSQVFFTNDPDADLNGDGIVNGPDFGIFSSLFFKPPGPSGLAP